MPVAVGVPDKTPLEEFSTSPAGSVPVATDHWIGPVPEAVNWWLYAVPTLPDAGAPLVMAGADVATAAGWVNAPKEAGPLPTVTVAVTVSVLRSMTETVLLLRFGT